MKTLLNSRKGQGTTEYMLILAIIVGIALLIGKGKLGQTITDKVNEISDQIKSGGTGHG